MGQSGRSLISDMLWGMRAEGIYWVRDHRNPCEWTIAKWNPNQAWWVLAWPSSMDREHGVCTDGRFIEIGPRILAPPNESHEERTPGIQTRQAR